MPGQARLGFCCAVHTGFGLIFDESDHRGLKLRPLWETQPTCRLRLEFPSSLKIWMWMAHHSCKRSRVKCKSVGKKLPKSNKVKFLPCFHNIQQRRGSLSKHLGAKFLNSTRPLSVVHSRILLNLQRVLLDRLHPRWRALRKTEMPTALPAAAASLQPPPQCRCYQIRAAAAVVALVLMLESVVAQ